MRFAINILLLLLIAGLIYLLFTSISEPIKFQNEYSKRKNAVVSKLMEIREAQQAYRGITGQYAPTFDTLKQVLKEGEFTIVKLFGDETAGAKIKREEFKVPAIDSIMKIKWKNAVGEDQLGFNLDSIEFVPYTDGKTFELVADTITYQQTRNVPVLEAKIPVKEFMGPFADPIYKRYDAGYNPDDPAEKQYYLKFGNMSKPTTAGNWE